MTKPKGIIILLVVALALAAVWLSVTRQDEATSASQSGSTVDAGEATQDPDANTAVQDDASQTEAPGNQETTAPAPQITQSDNWVCTTWRDGSGATVSTGVPNSETCTQWSIRQGPITQ